MKVSISFSREKEESLESKARWFQKKTIAERLVAAFEWLDFIRLISPKKAFYDLLAEKKSVVRDKDAQDISVLGKLAKARKRKKAK